MKPFIEKEIRLAGHLTLELVARYLNKYTSLHKKRSIISTYFDTKTLDLLKNSIAIRTRTVDNRDFFELKIEKEQGHALEWQVKSEKKGQRLDNPNLWGLPNEKYLKSINAIPHSFKLKEKIDMSFQTFFTNVERTSWKVKYKEAIFIISLDEGFISDDRVTDSIIELEIEVDKDPKNYFLDFCLAIQTKFPLTYIEGRTKAYRGVELIHKNSSLMFANKKKLIKLKKKFPAAKTLFMLAKKIITLDSSSFIERKSQNYGLSLSTSVHQMKKILVILGYSDVFFNANEHKILCRELYTFDKLLQFHLKNKLNSQDKMESIIMWRSFVKSQSMLLINLKKYEEYILKFSNF